MDQTVRDALARWPDVPAAYGWLSLDPRGAWRFHPEGKAADGGPGEPITNTQILAFIGRNYLADEAGNWYFQNGPQRAYVRIDAAPLILRYAGQGEGWMDHTGATRQAPTQWWLDDLGRLFARTDRGPAMVDDRELMAVLDDLRLAEAGQENDVTLDRLATLSPGESLHVVHKGAAAPTALACISSADMPTVLGFIPYPTPKAS